MGKTRGTSKLFTEHEIKQLELNPNVMHVTAKSITYAPAFKIAAVKAYEEGYTPMEIFRKAGFDIDVIGHKKPKHCLKRWRNTFTTHGEEGLLEERRGKGSSGRRPTGELSAEEKLKRAEARIKLLEAEKRVSKKARCARKAEDAEEALTPSERYQIINNTIRQYNLHFMTRYLCKMANVSASGYYRWLRAEEARQLREDADEHDIKLIREHFYALRGKAGALVIKMRLERESGVIMNHKKIRRLMRKYKLVATIRQANPYRKLAKATQEHKTCPNLLQRQFDQGEPERVLLTDITYMYYGNGQCAYLSVVKDGATKQILAHYLSSSLELSLVKRTLKRLFHRLDGNIHPEAILHSDQGMHYTHPKIRRLIRKAGFKQSMSRKGNCWDNASMESFFGHMKDDLEYKTSQTLQELRNRVDSYISYYNSERYQWSLKK
ncbi:IS3 family transposase, partial [Brevibacillus borstelensis]|uniref:IS3 family transposase n=1 Tax=Brevibacillus borstelensis TaxID=45462 RepID=UPI0030C49633